jgi:hypothetical protein
MFQISARSKPVIDIESFNPEEDATVFETTVYNELFKVDWQLYR